MKIPQVLIDIAKDTIRANEYFGEKDRISREVEHIDAKIKELKDEKDKIVARETQREQQISDLTAWLASVEK